MEEGERPVRAPGAMSAADGSAGDDGDGTEGWGWDGPPTFARNVSRGGGAEVEVEGCANEKNTGAGGDGGIGTATMVTAQLQ